MTTVLVSLSIAMLLAGIVIAVLPPASKGNHKITIKNDLSVVTVRSAGASDISITFDPAELGPQTPPLELHPGMEEMAEREPSVLDELDDPATTLERRREIARLLRELGYAISLKEDRYEKAKEEAARKDAPVTSQPMEVYDSTEECDEAMMPPEPDEYND